MREPACFRLGRTMAAGFFGLAVRGLAAAPGAAASTGDDLLAGATTGSGERMPATGDSGVFGHAPPATASPVPARTSAAVPSTTIARCRRAEALWGVVLVVIVTFIGAGRAVVAAPAGV
jgi:hypothetical protein